MESRDFLNIVDIDRLKEYERHRDCYDEAMDAVKDDAVRICVLYGLRRTGKSVLMSQIAKELNQAEKCLYISCGCDNRNKLYPKMSDFLDMLEEALKEGYRYVFVDEMTYIKELQGQGAVLSDYYGVQGLKVIATGTDSLNYSFASNDTLYDRVKMIHTSYVSFEEYHKLLGKSFDEYIEYGGTLETPSPYKNKTSMEKYTNTAIVDNILHALENSECGDKWPPALTELYDNEILKSAINRCINQMNQSITMKALTRAYKSSPLHAGINNAAHDFPYEQYIDVEAADQHMKEILGITDEMPFPMKPEHLAAVKGYLQELDLLQVIPVYQSLKGLSGRSDIELITQPGMMYCHAAELVNSLMDSDMWKRPCSADMKSQFHERVLRQMKGCILENMVIADLYNNFKDNCYVSKLNVILKPQDDRAETVDTFIRLNNSDTGHIISERVFGQKEIDAIVVDRKSQNVYLFEVKYSENMEYDHTKNLRNKAFLDYVEQNFGSIAGRYVIYNGNTGSIKDDYGTIGFVTAEDILSKISKFHENIAMLAEKMQDLKAPVQDLAVLSECPFLSSDELMNWKIYEEQLINERHAKEMAYLDGLWKSGITDVEGSISLEEYTTRKTIIEARRNDELSKVAQRYETYKSDIKAEPELLPDKHKMHQSIKI